MELKELRLKAEKMLTNFIDEIGLDGNFFISQKKPIIAYGKTKSNANGEFITPGTKRLHTFLQKAKYTNEVKEKIAQNGIILLNNFYKYEEIDIDSCVTMIHEMLHFYRNLLIFDVARKPRDDMQNEMAYNYNNGLRQNTHKHFLYHADASQDILKGSIDTSKHSIDKYSTLDDDTIDKANLEVDNISTMMTRQMNIDETLVDLMAELSYTLYTSKQRGKPLDIWQALEKARTYHAKEDSTKKMTIMCDIILRHHDLELFNWMLDPISYSGGDIHYDFFGNYTKNDSDLTSIFYEEAEKEEGFDVNDEFLEK